MKKKLLNPRGYLSWTQVDMWERSPERYVARYMHGGADLSNAAMEFGKKTSDALESGAETGDLLLDTVVAMLPHYEKREHEIRVTFKTEAGEVDLLGKLDTYGIKKGPRFREYKTGRVPWTEAKARKHGQIKHYSGLIYLDEGVLPTEAWLDWAETAWGEDGELGFTGKIASFHVTPTMQETLQYLARVSRVAREIDARYRAELAKMA